jgi:hypothetical protein
MTDISSLYRQRMSSWSGSSAPPGRRNTSHQQRTAAKIRRAALRCTPRLQPLTASSTAERRDPSAQGWRPRSQPAGQPATPASAQHGDDAPPAAGHVPESQKHGNHRKRRPGPAATSRTGANAPGHSNEYARRVYGEFACTCGTELPVLLGRAPGEFTGRVGEEHRSTGAGTWCSSGAAASAAQPLQRRAYRRRVPPVSAP